MSKYCIHIVNITKGEINFKVISVDRKEKQLYPSPKRGLSDTCAHSNTLQDFPFSRALRRGEQLNIDH